MNATESRSYDDLRPTLKNGDLVLFSGKGGISEWIKRFTRSPWSHIGMVYVAEDLDVVALLESTTLSNLRDLVTGRKREGVQMVELSKRLRTYPGEVAVRQLKTPLSPESCRRLAAFRKEISRVEYERSYWQLVKAGLGWNKSEDLSSIFCSELVAEAYQRIGLLDEVTPSNNYTPETFSKHLVLNENGLGGLIRVTKPGIERRRRG